MARANKEQIELMIKQGKSNARILMNTSLIIVAFTAFSLIVTLQSRILINQHILTMQLIVSIPLLLTSTLANSKLCYTKHEGKWEHLAWITFILGYGFLMNVVGLLINMLVGNHLAFLFLGITILLTLLYSAVEISYKHSAFKHRLTQDFTYIAIILLLGIIPML